MIIMQKRLKQLIKDDIELSQQLAELRVLRQSNFQLENQVLELNEKISFLRNELMKYQNFKDLRSHYLRTISEQHNTIKQLQKKLDKLESYAAKIDNYVFDRNNILQNIFDKINNDIAGTTVFGQAIENALMKLHVCWNWHDAREFLLFFLQQVIPLEEIMKKGEKN